jgi:hypothetical protein
VRTISKGSVGTVIPYGAEVPVLLKLLWLAVDIFADVAWKDIGPV